MRRLPGRCLSVARNSQCASLVSCMDRQGPVSDDRRRAWSGAHRGSGTPPRGSHQREEGNAWTHEPKPPDITRDASPSFW